MKFIASLAIPLLFLISCKPEVQQHSELDSLLEKRHRDSIEAHQVPFEWIVKGNQQFGDLDSMLKRRIIRAVVPYSLTYYYIDGKDRRGIAFDALNLFEQSLNKKLNYNPSKVRVVFIPVNREQVLPMVEQGYGDVGVAGFESTEEKSNEIDFTAPTISGLKEIIIGSKTAPALTKKSDLSGKDVYVRRGSNFEASLLELNDSLVKEGHAAIRVKEIDPYLEIEDVLPLVNAGIFQYTVSYENIAELWNKVLDSLVLYRNISVKKDISLSWIVRKNSPKLSKELNQFIEKNHHGTFMGNVLYHKYMNVNRLKHVISPETQVQLHTLSPLFKKYAAQYKLDWLLLAAQGFQESQLNQNVRSPVGAIGIMQIMPSVATSKAINIPNVQTIENNIHAGAKVMRYVIDNYFHDVASDSLNRQLLALAAYNAGPTRITRLRKEANVHGLNPNIWFDHVENVVAQHVGRETVQYVSNIYKYYTSFKALEVFIDVRHKHEVAVP